MFNGVFIYSKRKDNPNRVNEDKPLNIPDSTPGLSLLNVGVWTNNSDRNTKDNFSTVDDQHILTHWVELPITNWKYLAESDSKYNNGPIVQTFYEAFQLGDIKTAIGTIDEDGVSLSYIQGFFDRVFQLESEHANLRQEIEIIGTK